jgi:Spy/CpxP family protein refolding chaperone
MNSLRIFGLIAAGVLACSSSYADPSDEPQPPHRLEKLQAELKLSDQQKQDIGKIFEETRPQLEALHKQGQALRDKMRERLKTVLTAEQMEKFDKLHQERRDMRRQRFGGFH